MINAKSAIAPCTIRTIIDSWESWSLEENKIRSITLWGVQPASDETAVCINSLWSIRHICVVEEQVITLNNCLIDQHHAQFLNQCWPMSFALLKTINMSSTVLSSMGQLIFALCCYGLFVLSSEYHCNLYIYAHCWIPHERGLRYFCYCTSIVVNKILLKQIYKSYVWLILEYVDIMHDRYRLIVFCFIDAFIFTVSMTLV